MEIIKAGWRLYKQDGDYISRMEII